MNRRENLNTEQTELYNKLLDLYFKLSNELKDKFNRSVSFGDVIVDRWERAKSLGFGENSNVYDSSLIIGDVKVGENCWIGPFTVIDGSGGLIISNNCTISAGVHIYTHDNVFATLSPNKYQITRNPVEIGHHTYIGPNSIIAKGVKIGNHSIVASNAFVNKSFPDNSIIAGTPAKKIGDVLINDDGEVSLVYN